MSNKVKQVTLIQVESGIGHGSFSREDLLSAKEGDTVGGFEVQTVVETDCDHKKRHWSLDTSYSDEPPKMHGKCTACDDEKVITPEEK